MTTQQRVFAAQLITRDDYAPAASEATGYSISGLAVPFGVEYGTKWWAEQFDPACVFDGLDSAKLYWQHRDAIGKVTGHSTDDAGLHIDAEISHTPRGDEAATLVRDGVIDSLSIGFEGIEYRVEVRDDGPDLEVWTHVRIREVSLVSFPAYDEATLTEVRAHNPEKGTPMPTTDTATAITRDDLDAVRDDLAEQIRATQTQLAERSAPPAPTVPRFRSFAEFARAYHKGDAEARALHDQWRDAARDVTINERAYDGGVIADTIARDPWVGDAIRLIDKGRKVLNSFQTAPLPAEGMTLDYGVLETNTVTVGKQAAEGDDLDKGKVTVGTDHASVGTYGGWSELSFQQLERSSISHLNLTRRAQLIAYAQQTEAEVRAVLQATITGNLTANHNLDLIAAPKAADWIALLVDAAEAYEDAGLPIDGLWLSKDKFKELVTLADTTDRLIFNIDGTGSNTVGELTVPGLESKLANVRARLLPGAAAGTGAFYNGEAITTWESAGAPVSLEDQNVVNLSRSYSVYGYLACAAEIPDAILPIEFAS